MSQEELNPAGQEDPFSGIRNWLKNISKSKKQTAVQDPNAISRREFLEKSAKAGAGIAATGVITAAGIKLVSAELEQREADQVVPAFDKFTEITPNLEARNFSSLNVSFSKTELNNFLAKYGQLPAKISFLFYDNKVPDQLPPNVLKISLFEGLMPGNAGRLENLQTKISAQLASKLMEAAKIGKAIDNPIAEKDFQTKIEKGLLPPLVHLSN